MSHEEPYYVTLTGSKNNSGDYLIKHRAFSLFERLRPDRKIIDLNGWEALTEVKLAIINKARCLVLLGGPAIQYKTRPNVYALVDDLTLITVPIVTMGIGWHSHLGTWDHTHNYALNQKTQELFRRVNASGYKSSVRDYHSLNVLASRGLDNFIMTGCPALFSAEHYQVPTNVPSKLSKVAFSLGVSLKTSGRMYRQMQSCVIALHEALGDASVLEVVFHHSLNEEYLRAHGSAFQLYCQQRKFAEWLNHVGIGYIDVSGSAKNLIDYYNSVDLHIGYRVHAHIYMNSVSKPTILLSEDGRGIALKDVIGGVNLKAFNYCNNSKLFTILRRFGISVDNFKPSRNFEKDLVNTLKYELHYHARLLEPKSRVDDLYRIMEGFICQLP